MDMLHYDPGTNAMCRDHCGRAYADTATNRGQPAKVTELQIFDIVRRQNRTGMRGRRLKHSGDRGVRTRREHSCDLDTIRDRMAKAGLQFAGG